MADRHVRRGGEEYAQALTALLPQGRAWPRNADSVIMKVVRGLAEIFGYVDRRAADLLEIEADPYRTIEMLDDWERNYGLPEPCVAEPLTLADRHSMLVRKITMLGAQSRAFFIGVAAWLGYTITITEYAPFMCGVSEAGDTRDEAGEYRWQIGPLEMRFYWTINVANAALSWFRSGESEAGIDPHLRIGLATDLECLLRRFKPAHTDIVFDYFNLRPGNPLEGTP